MPGDFSRLEASRLARDPRDLTRAVAVPPAQLAHRTGFARTDFAVGREYEDGRFVPTHTNMTRDLAEAVAGRKRDESTEADVARQLEEHWTWNYRQQKGNGASNGKRRGFIPQRRAR